MKSRIQLLLASGVVLGVTAMAIVACNEATVQSGDKENSSSLRQSPQLKRFLSKHPLPSAQNPKQSMLVGFWDDALSVVKEIGRCVVADGLGALATGIAVLEISGNPDAAAVGAVIGGVTASVEEALDEDLVAPGSPNPFNSERPPYNGNKPNSLDSVGWYHNSTLKTAVINGSSLSLSEVRSSVINSLTSAGIPSSAMSASNLTMVDTSTAGIRAATTISGAIAAINAKGYTTEASYYTDLWNDIEYLHQNSYTLDQAISLVEEYKDDVDNLNISSNRKFALKRSLSVFAYSFALWSTNS